MHYMLKLCYIGFDPCSFRYWDKRVSIIFSHVIHSRTRSNSVLALKAYVLLLLLVSMVQLETCYNYNLALLRLGRCSFLV